MKKKLNKFDIFIIIVVVALIAGAFLKFFVLGNSSVADTTDTEITYTVKLTNLRNYRLDMLQAGDKVYGSSTKAFMGSITNVEVTPAQVLIDTQDGQMIWGEAEDRYDAVITIQVSGSVQNGQYRVGTTSLRVNDSPSLYTKYTSFSGVILSVE